MTVAAVTTERDVVLARYRAHVNHGRASLAQMMGAPLEVSSDGAIVLDERGQRHLDCGGYGVFILGHRHPAVVAAVKEQIDRHPLATRTLLEPRLAEASEALARVAPEGLEYAVFAGAGAEAVEAALKLARLNGRSTFVAATSAFHGKTFGALSVTGRDAYRAPFEPLLSGVRRVAFGDATALEAVLACEHRGTCAVLLEPVQAEAGVVVPPSGYLTVARALCDRFGALLILDEVQTGLGRVGAWWGADLEGVIPDLLLVGKGLSGGVVPVSALVARPEVFAPLNRDPMLHTSTFGGAPIGVTAAHATIRAIEDEDVVDRAARLGARLLQETREALRPYGEVVAEVRGVGLLIGVELREDGLAADFTLELLQRHVIAAHSLNANSVVRLTPPVCLGEPELEWLRTAVRASAEQIARRHARRR